MISLFSCSLSQSSFINKRYCILLFQFKKYQIYLSFIVLYLFFFIFLQVSSTAKPLAFEYRDFDGTNLRHRIFHLGGRRTTFFLDTSPLISSGAFIESSTSLSLIYHLQSSSSFIHEFLQLRRLSPSPIQPPPHTTVGATIPSGQNFPAALQLL